MPTLTVAQPNPPVIVKRTTPTINAVASNFSVQVIDGTCSSIKALMEDIVVRQIFGAVQGFVWRIEWQARGLPRVHLLVIFSSSH
jgi:hypothetical protein